MHRSPDIYGTTQREAALLFVGRWVCMAILLRWYVPAAYPPERQEKLNEPPARGHVRNTRANCRPAMRRNGSLERKAKPYAPCAKTNSFGIQDGRYRRQVVVAEKTAEMLVKAEMPIVDAGEHRQRKRTKRAATLWTHRAVCRS